MCIKYRRKKNAREKKRKNNKTCTDKMKMKTKQNKDISEQMDPVVVEREIEMVLLMVAELNLVLNLFVLNN